MKLVRGCGRSLCIASRARISRTDIASQRSWELGGSTYAWGSKGARDATGREMVAERAVPAIRTVKVGENDV